MVFHSFQSLFHRLVQQDTSLLANLADEAEVVDNQAAKALVLLFEVKHPFFTTLKEIKHFRSSASA